MLNDVVKYVYLTTFGNIKDYYSNQTVLVVSPISKEDHLDLCFLRPFFSSTLFLAPLINIAHAITSIISSSSVTFLPFTFAS